MRSFATAQDDKEKIAQNDTEKGAQDDKEKIAQNDKEKGAQDDKEKGAQDDKVEVILTSERSERGRILSFFVFNKIFLKIKNWYCILKKCCII
ncbi:MAG: hypothetical protein K6343_05615 [Caldisericaceae bacterium]